MWKHKKKTAATALTCLSIASPFIAKEEGLRTAAYLDSVGVPTICYGDTDNVRMGDVKTVQECNALFHVKLGVFSYAVRMAIKVEMNPYYHAAITSWTYNVGIGAMKGSTLVKIANTGDLRGSCDQLLRWKFAGGKPILLGRRQRERALCLTEL